MCCAQLSDNNRQIELLTEQIRIMNQRFFGRKSEASVSEVDGQISLFDSFNEVEYLKQDSSKEPEITEVIIPETFIVDEHHVHIYASKSNDGTILKAPRAKDLFRNSIATPDLSATERKKQRQLVLSEKVEAYFVWAKQKYSQVTHNSTIGKALAYSINQEEYLRVFLSDGHVPMDNNYAEQASRPFTIGRKNFVMIESSNGAKAGTILYSLVETAKANMINTFEYFNLLLTEIPKHMDDKDLRFIDDLLPWSPRVQKECPSRYKKS